MIGPIFRRNIVQSRISESRWSTIKVRAINRIFIRRKKFVPLRFRYSQASFILYCY